LLQRLLFGRDHWRPNDFLKDRLTGMQIWNGLDDPGFEKGREEWIKLLLAGKRRVLIAGNDAHGNFGRSRQIAIPFLSMEEKEQQLFGQVRTGILSDASPLTMATVLQALKAGQCLVSSGPFGLLEIITDQGCRYALGDYVAPQKLRVLVTVQSSSAFGPICSVDLFIGDEKQKKETRISLFKENTGLMEFKYEVIQTPVSGYIRLEVTSMRKEQKYLCLTNPIFIQSEDTIKKV
jgi:hypothetical protein